MKIQSVAILGAGAVGCYVLWGLADKAAANALQLGVVAEGSRAERLRQTACQCLRGRSISPCQGFSSAPQTR